MMRALPTHMVKNNFTNSEHWGIYSWRLISGTGFSPSIRPVMAMAELVAMRVHNPPAISSIDPERTERKPNNDKH